MKRMNKKGMEGAIALFGALGLAVLMFGIMGIYTSVTAKVNTDVGQTFYSASANTTAWNASQSIGTGITNLAGNFPLMGTVLGIAAVLSIIGLIGYGGYQMYKGR